MADPVQDVGGDVGGDGCGGLGGVCLVGVGVAVVAFDLVAAQGAAAGGDGDEPVPGVVTGVEHDEGVRGLVQVLLTRATRLSDPCRASAAVSTAPDQPDVVVKLRTVARTRFVASVVALRKSAAVPDVVLIMMQAMTSRVIVHVP